MQPYEWEHYPSGGKLLVETESREVVEITSNTFKEMASWNRENSSNTVDLPDQNCVCGHDYFEHMDELLNYEGCVPCGPEVCTAFRLDPEFFEQPDVEIRSQWVDLHFRIDPDVVTPQKLYEWVRDLTRNWDEVHDLTMTHTDPAVVEVR